MRRRLWRELLSPWWWQQWGWSLDDVFAIVFLGPLLITWENPEWSGGWWNSLRSVRFSLCPD